MIQTTKFARYSFCALALCTCFFAFHTAEACKAALIEGLSLCATQLFFALFPFLVIASLIAYSSVAPLLGIVFRPLCCLLGFSNAQASSILLLGTIGGFAPAANAIRAQVLSAKLTAKEAADLLPACICLGPSFVIFGVGDALLHSRTTGFILFLSQLLACWSSTFILRVFSRFRKKGNNIKRCETNHTAQHVHTATLKTNNTLANQHDTPAPPSLAQILGDCTVTFLRLCGVLLYFRFLHAGIASYLPQRFTWLPALFLETTTACALFAQNGHHASFLCCASISLLSASILLQSTAILPPNVSLRPLLSARLLHLPLSLFFCKCLFTYLPQAQTVFNSLPARVIIRNRLPLDQALLLFGALLFTSRFLMRQSPSHAIDTT